MSTQRAVLSSSLWEWHRALRQAETVKKVFQDAKDTIVSKVVSMKPLEEEKIEEFFDDEDEEEDYE